MMILSLLLRSTNLFADSVRIALAFLFFFACSSPLFAQDMGREVAHDTLEKYGSDDLDRLGPSFHASRRHLVLDSMPAHTLALFTAAEEKTRANDIAYEFHQAPNLYYLTGCLEPESALLLSKDPIAWNGRQVHEILFVRPRDPQKEVWTGRRLGVEGALAILRPEAAMIVDSLPGMLATLLPATDSLYFRPGWAQKSIVLGERLPMTDSIVVRELLEKYPRLTISKSLANYVGALREVKTPDELRLMRRAIAISNEAHNDVMKNARPGWYEYQIQGLAESIFTKHGAEYTAYPCIVGSGPNSTILHYETNRRQIHSGDFIEMDMGAEYHGYAADVTRSFPISGHFTPEQRAIYSLVLEAQDSGIALCKAGAPFLSAHRAAVRVISRGLVRLGISKDTSDYRKYFMHGTSHYLGLDVHDAGTYGPLRPGNVLTVEPGVYVAEGSPCDKKWWNIGCRIEDDILITPAGPENLSAGSPRTISDLERLMTSSR